MEILFVLCRYILLYIILIFGSIYIAKKLNKKIETCLIIDFSLIMFAMCIFSILNIMYVGVWVISIISLFLGIITIYQLIKEKNKEFFKQKIQTTGLMFFTIIYFIFFVTTMSKILSNWDQFTYWSYYAKNMYYTNSLIFPQEYAVNIILYPPVPSILQYFFMKIIGTYSQGIEAFATWMLCFSLIIPLFENIKNNKIAKISLSIITLCIPAVFITTIFYKSSYPDVLLGLLIGFIIYTYIFENDKRYSKIALLSTFIILSLTKATGFYIAVILIFILAIYEKMAKKEIKLLELLKSKELKHLYIIILTILVVFVSWNVYIKLNTKPLQAESLQAETNSQDKQQNKVLYVIDSVINTIFASDLKNQDALISNRNLIYKLYNTIGLSTPITISLIATALLFLIFAVYIQKNKLDDDERKKFKFGTISIYIGLILYIIFLQLTYLIIFSTKEMINHDGIERYLASFLLGILYFITAVSIHNANKKQSKNIEYIIIALIIITITPIYDILDATIIFGLHNSYERSEVIEAQQIAEKIDKNITQNSKVLAITQIADDRVKNYMIRYYIYPKKIEIMEPFVKDTENSIEKFKDVIKNYDYIYLYTLDDYFIKNTTDLNKDITPQTFYKVIKSDNVTLEKIEL